MMWFLFGYWALGTTRRTERTTGTGLIDIPLEDLLLGDTSLAECIDGSGATATLGSNDDDLGHASGLLSTLVEGGLHISYKSILIGIALDTREGFGVVQLPGPDLESQGGSSKTSVEAKSLSCLVSAPVIHREVHI